MPDCERCSHPTHTGHVCGYYLVETVSDTVGFLAPPTGIVRDILVGQCRCITVGILNAE